MSSPALPYFLVNWTCPGVSIMFGTEPFGEIQSVNISLVRFAKVTPSHVSPSVASQSFSTSDLGMGKNPFWLRTGLLQRDVIWYNKNKTRLEFIVSCY